MPGIFSGYRAPGPTVTELRVIDTYWSDHCRHTTFLTRLEQVEIEKGALSGAIEEALKPITMPETQFTARIPPGPFP